MSSTTIRRKKGRSRKPLLTIEAGQSEAHYWRDLWRFRRLFFLFAWRDVSVRYKQTALGVLWAVLQPFLTMLALVLVFKYIAKMPDEGIPYPIVVYSATLPWQFFATSLQLCSNSLVSNSQLLSKVYFPRLVLPMSSIMVALVDFTVSMGVFALILLWYGFMPTMYILLLPLLLLVVFALSFGVGLLFATLNVSYRDFRYVIPFVVQIGMYLSPVGYRSSAVPESLKFLYFLNPMVGVIDGFRAAIIGNQEAIYWPGFLMSLVVIAVIFCLAIMHFRRHEKTFADVI